MMNTEEAWEIMNQYRIGLAWTPEHVTAVRLLVDEDLDHFEQVWARKYNSWACVHDLIDAIIRERVVREYDPG
jgi:hypothetical protein